MNIQYSQFKKINSFLSSISPTLAEEAAELDKAGSERLIARLVFILDALFKGENLNKKRNLILPEGRSFLTVNIVEVLANISLYLYKFDTGILNFTRTERQTFIFILENIIDYFKSNNYYAGQKDKRNLFIDYRFWIENFFKILDQKITGSVYLNRKVNLRSFFASDDSVKNQLYFSNGTVSFSLSPFIVVKGSQNLFLTGITDNSLVYKDIDFENEIQVKGKYFEARLFEFLVSNFDFPGAQVLRPRLKGEDIEWLGFLETIKEACDFHKERQFKESQELLLRVPLERLAMPLVYLLQIKNLVNLNRVFEVKQLMQNFVLQYPQYVDVYEIMGDIYQQEGNLELAVNFYEKVLLSTQNKRVAEKLKKVKESRGKTPGQGKATTQASDYYYDITSAALSSEEDIILREKELRQMIEVLLSKSRRNLMLVGESGVGKTALIRRLAQKLFESDVPGGLKGKRLKEINFVSLLTGSKYRGQFEEKALKLLNEFKTQNSILIMEDIHLMIAVGAARGTSLDLVNILKQFLRDNSVQVIATTNYEEFKNTIEKDNALMGFFQKLRVNELTVSDSRQILNNLARKCFAQEKIVVSNEIVDDIVESAKRDVREKKLPDAAIMVFERTIAKAKLKGHTTDPGKYEIEQNDVVEVLSDMLNLPESNISVSLKNRLVQLKESLLDQIVGQDPAINRVAASIITSKLDFDIKKNRPDGVFLFIGPTGVGKTETALALTRALYGSEDYLIRIDMSEYMEKFTYSRFVGAAPGYVGYMDSNQLTDKVRQNPYSVILLDEIEKADSQLLNIFLQVFDAGRLTDARGNVVDFSHATIIMTSNIGTSLFSKSQMGYRGDLESSDVSHASLLKALKKYFSPEFLNRVDEIVIFNHLQRDDIKKIIEIQLKSTRDRFEKLQKELILKDDLIDYVIENGYSKEYGARHVGRALKKEILEKVAHRSLEKDWEDACQVVCCLDDRGEVAIHLEMEPVEESRDKGNLMERVTLKG